MKRILLLGVVLSLCVVLCSCGWFVDILDSMLEHDHKYTYTLVAGDEPGTFDLHGNCPYEYCENPNYVEKNVKVYVSEEEYGTCLAGGKIVYSYDVDGETVSYTVEGGAAYHKLCGVSVFELEDSNGLLDSSMAGVFVPAGSVCGSIVTGSYRCDACNKDVSALVSVSHEGKWNTVMSPTCTTMGIESTDCTRCTAHVERPIAALGHNYKVEIQAKGDRKFDLSLICRESGCTAGNVTYSDVKAITLASEISSTCIRAGEKTYTYEKDGETCSVTIRERLIGHTLNGADPSSLCNADGSIDFGTKGVYAYDESTLSCGSYTEGYYKCDTCSRGFDARLYVKAHHIEDSVYWSITEPTCQADGRIVKECKYCSYVSVEKIARESADLYHKINVSVKLAGNTIEGATVSGSCSVSGCNRSFSNLPMDLGSYSFTTDSATCSVAGEIHHSWTAGGIPISYVTTNLTTGHTVNDNSGKAYPLWALEDEDGALDFSLDAVELFAEESIKCEEIQRASCKCASCGGLLIVNAKMHHEMQEISRVQPTCTTDGVINEKCKNCSVTATKPIPASHTVEYVHNLAANTLTIKCSKATAGCDYQSTTIDLSKGKLAIIKVISHSTCQTNGQVEYFLSYTENGQNKTLTFIGKTELTGHYIKDNNGNKVCADDLCDSEGRFDSSLNALDYFSGHGKPAVGSTDTGYYICEECGGFVRVTVINTGK